MSLYQPRTFMLHTARIRLLSSRALYLKHVIIIGAKLALDVRAISAHSSPHQYVSLRTLLSPNTASSLFTVRHSLPRVSCVVEPLRLHSIRPLLTHSTPLCLHLSRSLSIPAASFLKNFTTKYGVTSSHTQPSRLNVPVAIHSRVTDRSSSKICAIHHPRPIQELATPRNAAQDRFRAWATIIPVPPRAYSSLRAVSFRNVEDRHYPPSVTLISDVSPRLPRLK